MLERYVDLRSNKQITLSDALAGRLAQKQSDSESHISCSTDLDASSEEGALAPSISEQEAIEAQKDSSTAQATRAPSTEDVKHGHPALITRRRVLIGAGVAGAAVLGAGVLHGFGILSPKPRRLADCTWADLQAIAQELADIEDESVRDEVAQRYGLLDEEGKLYLDRTKTVEVEGQARHVMLWGICHDRRPDGTLCGLTFSFNEVVGQQQMCTDPAYAAGWSMSDLRSWLNQEDGFLLQLPEDLREVIQPVQKFTNNVGAAHGAGDVSPTEETIWLPSYTELIGARAQTTFSDGFGYLGDILNAEGTQYRIFRQQNAIHRGSENVFIRNRDGEPAYWWLRTPSPDVTENKGVTYFNQAAPNGDVFHNAVPATETSGIIPCFCL